jgi:DNA transformation protein
MQRSSYVDYIEDMLMPFGDIRIRKMFGGYGIYKGSLFFALIIDDALYFKVSNQDCAIYEKLGSKPFSYIKKNGKQVAMSYWEFSNDIIENNSKFAKLVNRALIAANDAKK